MACNVTILNAFGSGTPLNKITVVGTVQDCPPDIEGSALEVELSCRSHNDEQSVKRLASVNSAGNWTATFLPPFSGCGCDGQVFINARCLSGDGCEAAPFTGTLKCNDCPSLRLTGNDDVDLSIVSVECDMDGSVLVSIQFDFFNDTSQILQPRINCGPGGTPVSSNTAFVTPNNVITVTGICRYNPSTTPVPAPFVDFVKFNGFDVLDCPPVPIRVPPLPNCENAICPTIAVLQVTNANGEVVIVEPPNEVLCLLPGAYTVSVVSPLPQPTIQYFWSQNGVQTSPLITDQSITVDLGAGELPTFSVVILTPNCSPLSGAVTLKGCVIDCDVNMSMILRDDESNVTPIDQACLQPGDYTLQVEGPVEPPWNFQWRINGTISTIITSSQFPFSIAPGETVAFEVTASAPNCNDKSELVTLRGCEVTVPPKTDSLGCAALLISAIGLLIAGAILIIIGVCTGTAQATIAGGIVAAAGVILLAIWFGLCMDTTSCNVMGKMRCALFYAGVTFAVVSLLLAWQSGIDCGFSAALSSIGWFGLQSLLTDAMIAKGCDIESCTL